MDGVMAINFLVDFLLLLGTNRLTGYPLEYRRMIAAALLGAVYSGACLLPDFRFLGNLLWRVVSLGLMGCLAFGWNRSALQRCGIFLILSMALGGLAFSLGRADWRTVILSASGLWLLCRAGFTGPVGSREYVPLQITHGDREVSLLALRDTGNTLSDPITGEPVLVISPEAATQLTGLTSQQLQTPLETIASRSIPGLRLLPYRSVGQGGSMMLSMRFRQVKIGNRCCSALVAFAPEGFGRGEVYQALTGGVV